MTTAAEIDEGAVDRLLTVLGEHGRIERDLARKAIIAALPAPASGELEEIAKFIEGLPDKGVSYQTLWRYADTVRRAALPAPASGGAVAVQRWRLGFDKNDNFCGMYPDPEGDWVAWEDVARQAPAPASGGAVAWLLDYPDGNDIVMDEGIAKRAAERDPTCKVTPLYPSTRRGVSDG